MAMTQRWLRPRQAGSLDYSTYRRRLRYGLWQHYLPLWMLAASRHVSDAEVPISAENSSNRTYTAYEPFEAFFHQHERALFGYLWRMTGDEQAAYDLCQKTFLRAWQHFAKVSAYERPTGWLFRVATNLALNYLRLRSVRTTATELDDVEMANRDFATQVTESDAIRRALMALALRHRAALVLREVYGLSCEEIAQALGISRGAAKTMLWRSRDAFRDHYMREGGQR